MIQRSVTGSLRTLSTASPCFRIGISRTASAPFPAQRLAAVRLLPRKAPRRWYSSEQEAAQNKDEPSGAISDEHAEAKAEAQKEDPVQKELESKNKEVLELTDRLKRSIADYRNLQEQTRREVQAAKDFALQRFSKDLIDSIDNLDRALTTVPGEKLTEANQDLLNLHSGLKMTEGILMQTLKRHGLERFDPSETTDRFDPNKHEATFQAPQPDKEDGTVFHTQQKGFLLNGRVIRPAKVGVVRNA